MDHNYRIHVTIRRQNGSVFNSSEFCTELYPFQADDCMKQIAQELEAWGIENLNAAEEYADAN